MSSDASFRTEKDLLGVLEVPAQAYYGIQTLRAVNNFRLSGVPISHYPKLVVGLAMVKQAAADANRELGHLSEAKHAAISEACARLIRGDFHEEFVVDMIQGGAGTSTNMNANEVIANIALEAMGHQKGEYQYLHPNNDVNMAQSTNDAYPTAIRLGLLLGHDALLASLDSLIQAFAAKGQEFAHVLKMGRRAAGCRSPKDRIPAGASSQGAAPGQTSRTARGGQPKTARHPPGARIQR